MNQFRIVADSSCDLLTLDGADFVSVRSQYALTPRSFTMTPILMLTRWSVRSATPKGVPTVRVQTLQTGKAHSVRAAM